MQSELSTHLLIKCSALQTESASDSYSVSKLTRGQHLAWLIPGAPGPTPPLTWHVVGGPKTFTEQTDDSVNKQRRQTVPDQAGAEKVAGLHPRA